MTAEEATKLGYAVIKASPFEVGLVRGEQGIRTWWARDFSGALPPLDHPLVMECILCEERRRVL